MYYVEIKNAVVVFVLIKHNGLCGRAISSSQLLQVDSRVDIFYNSWFSQETYEYICLYNSEIMLV